MDKIEIRSEDIVPLQAISTGVVGLRVLFVNVFGVRGPAGWVLVDAGLYGSAGSIRRWAKEHFGTTPPAAVLLTHAHFDHVGALEDLLGEWKAPVYAHQDELPYVTGTLAYPPPDPSVGGGLMARMSMLYPRRPVHLERRVLALPADGSIPILPGWRAVHTPGHTAGHVAFFREADRTLIAGDAFCTTRQESFLAVALQRPELHGPPSYFTTDWPAARQSVSTLAALQPNFIAPGHGQPMAGPNASKKLEELAAHFDEVAVPERGRYVDHPTPR
jgi:glyoxylase-like metal-dependent hydrolase (beta-lactamase superfamily II)